MSHAIGADQELRLHRGTLNGVILPTILRFNKDHVGNKYSKILRAMGKNSSADLADEGEILNEAIGLPNGLAAMGVTEDMIPSLVDHSITIQATQLLQGYLHKKNGKSFYRNM